MGVILCLPYNAMGESVIVAIIHVRKARLQQDKRPSEAHGWQEAKSGFPTRFC